MVEKVFNITSFPTPQWHSRILVCHFLVWLGTNSDCVWCFPNTPLTVTVTDIWVEGKFCDMLVKLRWSRVWDWSCRVHTLGILCANTVSWGEMYTFWVVEQGDEDGGLVPPGKTFWNTLYTHLICAFSSIIWFKTLDPVSLLVLLNTSSHGFGT